MSVGSVGSTRNRTQELWSQPLGSLLSHHPGSLWSPQLQQVQTQGAEGPGETRGSEQGVLETPTARPWLTSGE